MLARPTITLCEDDKRNCIVHAGRKTRLSRDSGVYDNNQSGEERKHWIEKNGFGGEIGFCRLFDCQIDWSLFIRCTHNDTFDTRYQGYTIDVKTTDRPDGRLIAGINKSLIHKPDFYALMVGKFPTYEFAGFMTADELLQEWRIKTLKYGARPVYTAMQSELLSSLPVLV